MIKLGITSPMGGGKTYVSRIFQELGVPIFNTDESARRILNSNTELRSEICKEFGNIYDDDGVIIPTLLRSIVYIEGAEDELKKLNSLVHPHVFKEYVLFCEKNRDKIYTIAESAILFESGMDNIIDDVIYVQADEETRIRRTFERSGFSREEYGQRMKSQLPEEKKLQISKFVIKNNDCDDVEGQVKDIDRILNG